jgi:hypothetical protein
MRYGLPPEPRLGRARWVKRFAWSRTVIQYGIRPVEGSVWLESYWREQVMWTDGSWRDGYSTAFLDSERVAYDRKHAPDGVRVR